MGLNEELQGLTRQLKTFFTFETLKKATSCLEKSLGKKLT